MTKRVFIILHILIFNLFATSDLGMYYNTNNQFIGIYPTDGSITINENNQDWVAVYPANASNDWNNVIQWAWARDLDSYSFVDNGITKYTKIFPDQGLVAGEYEVRYFLNNTYNTYRFHNFEIAGDIDAQLLIVNQTETILSLNSTFQGEEQGQTWIGIYEKDAGNDWNNVRAWSWITQSENSFDISNLEAGVYEARLFYNNSYNIEKEIEFTVIEHNPTPTIEITNQTSAQLTLNSTFEADNSWIAVFKKDEQSEYNNVVTWSWVTQNETILDISDLAEGTYEARLFYNGSYILEDKVEFVVTRNLKIFIIGDSTVYKVEPNRSGWGNHLTDYTKESVEVFNRAKGGASTKSYLTTNVADRNWQHTKNIIQNTDISDGAYLLIQFGHNDARADLEFHTEAGVGESYYNNLKIFIDEARNLGVNPILVTSVAEQFKDRPRQRMAYVNTMIALAEDENVPLLRLGSKSWQEFNTYNSTGEILDVFGDAYRDHIHFGDNGASIVAGWVKELICNSQDQILCNSFR